MTSLNDTKVGEARKAALAALDDISRWNREPVVPLRDRDQADELVEFHRRQVREGRYRVIFLGAFNVGKTMLINGLLGAEYLPSAPREYTSHLTDIRHAPEISLNIHFKNSVSRTRLEKLAAICSECASVLPVDSDERQICLRPSSKSPKGLRTVAELFLDSHRGESGFTSGGTQNDPEMEAVLRETSNDIDKVTFYVPLPDWAEDIILTDTPGVHSISETRQEITYNVIPKSHLVVMLVDSNTAGNAVDGAFIKKVAEFQQRKVLFVINKIDTVHSEGDLPPIRQSLLRSLPDEIRDAETFFVSGLFALSFHQLRSGRMKPAEVEANNALRGALFDVIMDSRDKTDEVKRHSYGGFLWEKSRFESFVRRVFEYLRHENKEMEVVNESWRFVWGRAGEMRRTVAQELKVACDPDELDRLRRNEYNIKDKREKLRKRGEAALRHFELRVLGGADDQGKVYEGLGTIVEKHFGHEAASELIAGVKRWLKDANLARVKKDADILSDELKTRLEAAFSVGQKELRAAMEKAEEELRAELENISMELSQTGGSGGGYREENFDSGNTGYYIAGTGIGVVAMAGSGALIGAWLTSWSGPGMAIGAGVGAVVGGAIGFLAAHWKSDDMLRDDLMEQITKSVHLVVDEGGEVKRISAETKKESTEPVTSIRQQMHDSIGKFASQIPAAYRAEFERRVKTLNAELDDLLRKGEELQGRHKEVGERLNPVLESLAALEARAQTALAAEQAPT